MELMGSATHLRRGYGAPSIEGKVTRVGARMEPRGREQRRWANRELEWSAGKSDIEGKVARVATSEWEASEFQMRGSA